MTKYQLEDMKSQESYKGVALHTSFSRLNNFFTPMFHPNVLYAPLTMLYSSQSRLRYGLAAFLILALLPLLYHSLHSSAGKFSGGPAAIT